MPGFLLLYRLVYSCRELVGCGLFYLWCMGFSLQWLLLFPSMASVVVTHGLSCLGDIPGPGIEPPSPALIGKFFTTGPSGQSQIGNCG